MTRRVQRRASWLAALIGIAAIAAGCVRVTTTGTAVATDALVPPARGLSTSAPGGSTSAPGESTSAPAAAPGSHSAQDPSMGPTRGTIPPASGTDPSPGAGRLLIGYISLGEQLPFARAVTRSVRDEAERRGVDVLACDSRLEPGRVRACARRLGEAGVAGAISFGAFPELGADICAALGGVPVVGVAYDQGPCQVSAVGTDNRAAGMLAGEALGRFSRDRWDCDISAWVSLESSAVGTLGAERMIGYREGYERHCPIPAQKVTVLDGTDRVATAEQQVARLLDDLPGRRILVVGLNEDAVSGALQAARRAGREEDIWVSGLGADPSARWSIACDEQYVASVAHLPERFGEVVVPTLLAAVEGQEVPLRIDTPIQLVSGRAIRDLYPATPPCDEPPGEE